MDNVTPITAAAPTAVEDPIRAAQIQVGRATNLIACIGLAFRDLPTEHGVDIYDACLGVVQLLENLNCELDPEAFRAAVLASEPQPA